MIRSFPPNRWEIATFQLDQGLAKFSGSLDHNAVSSASTLILINCGLCLHCHNLSSGGVVQWRRRALGDIPYVRRCPLYSRKQTSGFTRVMCALCRNKTGFRSKVDAGRS